MSIFRFLALFLAILVSVCGATDSTTTAASNHNQQAPYDNSEPQKDDTPKVIQLTSRSFDSSIKDGSVWLVEFYGESSCSLKRDDFSCACSSCFL
jgi:hypothetical protein